LPSKRTFRGLRATGFLWSFPGLAICSLSLAQQPTTGRPLAAGDASPNPEKEALWQPPPPRIWAFDPSKVDFSVGIYAQLLATRTIDVTQTSGSTSIFQEQTQGTSPSAGVLGTFHQQFRGWIGYNVNFGYTQTDEEHSVGSISTVNGVASLSYAKSADRMNVYEFSVGYVVKAPTSSHRLQTFAEGGPGGLVYQPIGPQSQPGYTNRKFAGMFGVGADLRMTEHLGLRIEYRGLLTKTPDSEFTGVGTESVFTVISEPAISLKYTFGAHPKMQ
jgi:hypothetical protein